MSLRTRAIVMDRKRKWWGVWKFLELKEPCHKNLLELSGTFRGYF
jgi:hypothetical protein